MSTACSDVASCLGLVNDGGIISCGFQDTLTDISCDTNKTLKELRCWKKSALNGVKTWLVVLTVFVILMFIALIFMCVYLGWIKTHVGIIEGVVVMSPWVPIPAPPVALQQQRVVQMQPVQAISYQPQPQPQPQQQQFSSPPPYADIQEPTQRTVIRSTPIRGGSGQLSGQLNAINTMNDRVNDARIRPVHFAQPHRR